MSATSTPKTPNQVPEVPHPDSDNESIVLRYRKPARIRSDSDDEDVEGSPIIPNRTPNKRQKQTPIRDESSFLPPGVPDAESTKIRESDVVTPRCRKRLIMSSLIDMIEIKRSSRPAAYTPVASTSAQVLPESASMGSSRVSSRRSSISSSTTDMDDSELDQTVNLVDWCNDSDDDIDDLCKSMKTVQFKLKGKDYDLFKPLNTDTLYYNIVNNHLEYEIFIRSWIRRYKDGEELASICEILQLFTDLIGFQTVIVKDVYTELETEQFKTKLHPVIEEINRADKHVTISKPMYLLASKQQWAKGVQMAFNAFFNKFIIECYTSEILYPVMIQFTYFFIHSTQSDLLPVIHTSTTIVLMMMNTMVECILFLLFNNGAEYTSKTFKWLKNMVLYYLRKINGSNKVIRIVEDTRLAPLRFDITHYLKCWIIRYPSLFLQEEKTYDLLKLLLIDRVDMVRKEAMRTCLIIASDTTPREHVKTDYLKHLLIVVIGRIQDVDITVAHLAMRCHTKAIERFPSFISNEKVMVTGTAMMFSLYSPYPVIRKQAFLNFCVTIKLSHLHGVQFLVKMAKTIHSLNPYSEKQTFTSFMIEAVHKEVPELSDFDLILRAMDSDLEDKEYEHYLLEIFCNSAKMQYAGYINYEEENAAKADTPDVKTKQMITKTVLQHLDMLLNRFDENHVKCIFETLNVFSNTELKNRENAELVKQLPELLIAQFNIHTKSDILSEITKFFANCMEGDGFYKRYFTTNARHLCATARSFHADYNFGYLENPSIEDGINNGHLLIKLHSLIKHVNLLQYSDLSWKDIFLNWNTLERGYSRKISSLQIQCCQHYLIWSLKLIIGDKYTNDAITQEILNLQIKMNEYIQYIIAIITNKDAKIIVQNNAFESLSNLYSKFRETMEGIPEENRQDFSKQLTLKQISLEDSAAICAFVTNKIDVAEKKHFKHTDIQKIQEYLLFIIKLLAQNAIDLVNAPHILKYFTDDLYLHFGEVLLKLLDGLATKPDVLTYVMWCTVRNIYKIKSCKSADPNVPLIPDYQLISSILNQFTKYLRKKRMSPQQLIALALKFAFYKQMSTDLLPLFIPGVERLSVTGIESLKTDLKKYTFRNKDDPNLKKFVQVLTKT